MINLVRSKLTRKPAETTEKLRDSEILVKTRTSSVGKCRRQSVYQRNNLPADENTEIEFRYLHYEMIKSHYITMLLDNGIIDDSNVKYTAENICGQEYEVTCDAVINKTGVIISIISGRATNFVQKNPRPQEVIRCGAALLSNSVNRTILSYIPIDGKEPIEYTVTTNGEVFLINNTIYEVFNVADLVKGITESGKLVKENTLPDKDYEYRYSRNKVKYLHQTGEISNLAYKKFATGSPIGDYQCRNCKYLRICYNLQGRI